jgi:hypothetical protein
MASLQPLAGKEDNPHRRADVPSLDVVHCPGAYLLDLLCAPSLVELGSTETAPVNALH